MDATEIAVVSVGGRLAFYPNVDTVAEIDEQADTDSTFTSTAEVVTTLDEFVNDIEAAIDHFDETDGVLHWSAPY